MKLSSNLFSRRNFLKSFAATATLMNISPDILLAAGTDKITRKIPGTDETLAIMGVGSYKTFDIGMNEIEGSELIQVMQNFFENGGQVVDSSPMYGNSETIIGALLRETSNKQGFFAATKVWTNGRQNGIDQMNSSMRKMGVEVMDLMQIHNLRDWKVHLQTLREWKQEGRIRYIGITTSGGRSHDELAEILKTEDVDFVQFTYNILDRRAEQTLFPIVRDKGLGTLINVPFRKGSLFSKVRDRQLPDWAAEFDCSSWAQFFLKFIGSHPDVTVIIPATSKVKHMVDNMGAGFGRLPDADTRLRMVDYMESI